MATAVLLLTTALLAVIAAAGDGEKEETHAHQRVVLARRGERPAGPDGGAGGSHGGDQRVQDLSPAPWW